MKKVLIAILALSMILSICSFPISADTVGTAITSEAEFLAMKEDGYYYLANDITITKSYEQFFTGVFDGNGKTVTVTGEPMFLEFCGKAKDLTINGEIVANHDKDNGYWARGAFACMTSGEGTIVLYNITNNANVTGFSAQESAYGLLGNAYAGGIIGAHDNYSVGTDAGILIVNCVNNGNVSGYHCTGGIAGILHINDQSYAGDQTAVVINSTNNGAITGINTYTGGLVGRLYYALDAKFTGCINNGFVTGYGNSGGMIGHTTASSLIMTACQNNGEIATTTDTGSTAYAGGLVGYAQGTNDPNRSADYGEMASRIQFCINTANVSGHRRAGGIVGSSGADTAYGITFIDHCINTGNVTNYGIVTTSHAQSSAGGIQGYAYGSKSKPQYAVITNCISIGNVEARNAEYGIASYILGYISHEGAIVANCSGSGILTSGANKTYCIGWNNNSLGFSDESTGNLFPANTTYQIAADAAVDACKGYVVGVFDESTLISGAVIADFNAAYKQATGATADCMTQKLDAHFNPQIVQLEVAAPEFPAPEAQPDTTPEETTKAPEPETTKAPEEETEAPKVDETEAPTVDATEAPAATDAPANTEPAEKKGCGGFVAGGIVIVALLGSALVIKKKD